MIIDKLPHIYLKEKLGNLYKIFQVVEEELLEPKEVMLDVREQDELDSATGKALDKHGELVGQRRAYLGDRAYRLLIKSRIKQNLSGGDIPTVNEFFTLILKDNYLGIKEGWSSPEYDNEPALVVFRYVHDIIEGGIEPVEPIKLNGITDLDGEYSLDGRQSGYFDSEIINFAKSLAKKVIAAGVKVVWEAPISAESSIDVRHDTSFLTDKNISTRDIQKIDGTVLLDGNFKLDANIPFVHSDVLSDVLTGVSSNQNAFLNNSLLLDGNANLDGAKDTINQGAILKIYESTILTEEVAI